MDDAVAPASPLGRRGDGGRRPERGETLDREANARDQVGFADRILLSKCDLVSPEAADEIGGAPSPHERARAPIRRVDMGACPIDEVLNIAGFNMNDILDVDPSFFVDDHHHHHHNDDIRSFVYETDRAFDPAKLDRYIMSLTNVYGPDLLRYKGVLFMKGTDRRVVPGRAHARGFRPDGALG